MPKYSIESNAAMSETAIADSDRTGTDVEQRWNRDEETGSNK
jgi:hypothetical protein